MYNQLIRIIEVILLWLKANDRLPLFGRLQSLITRILCSHAGFISNLNRLRSTPHYPLIVSTNQDTVINVLDQADAALPKSIRLPDAMLLAHFIRMIRPAHITEFGTGYGVSTRFMSLMVKAEGLQSKIHTYGIEDESATRYITDSFKKYENIRYVNGLLPASYIKNPPHMSKDTIWMAFIDGPKGASSEFSPAVRAIMSHHPSVVLIHDCEPHTSHQAKHKMNGNREKFFPYRGGRINFSRLKLERIIREYPEYRLYYADSEYYESMYDLERTLKRASPIQDRVRRPLMAIIIRQSVNVFRIS